LLLELLGAGLKLLLPPPDELPPDGRELPPPPEELLPLDELPPPLPLCWALAERAINEHSKPFTARVNKYLYVFFMIMCNDFLFTTVLGFGLVIDLTKFIIKGLIRQLKKSVNVAFYK